MKRWLAIWIIYSPLIFARSPKHEPAKIRYADSLLNLAEAIYYSNPDSSFYYSGLALDYSLKYKLDVQTARAWHSQARTEVLRGDIEPALKRLKDAVAIFEVFGLKERVAKSYALMSTALSKIHNDEECINLLMKAIAIYRQLHNTDGLKATLTNLANTYTEIRKFDEALAALDESKQYIRPGESQWFYYYINAGIIYSHQKKYSLAETQFDSCIVISRRNNMVDAEITAITRLAELCMKTKRFSEAAELSDKAVYMSRANHLPLEESDALKVLIHYYETSGNYRNAYICQNRLKVISDSLFNIEKVRNITTVEARLKVSEREKTIALQKLDMEKSAAEQEKSSKRIGLLIAGSSFLAMVLFFTFYVYTKTKRQKREVELQKTRAERLNSLNQKIFAVIAHDFKSPMITLNMLMDLMDKENISKEDLSTYSADVRNQIAQSGQILDNLLNWAKTELNLSHTTNIKASPFLVAGEIIKELHYVSARKNIIIINEIPESLFLKVPPDILKIITRNLLSNAVKFSYSDATVTIGTEDGNTILVKDHGSGISEKTRKALFNATVQSKLGTFNETGFGLGLYITYELISKFNGKIMVEDNHPSGTVFKFVLPVYEQHKDRNS